MNNGYNDDIRNYQQGGIDENARSRAVLTKTFVFMFAVLIITAITSIYSAASNLTYNILVADMMIPLLIGEVVIVIAASAVMNKGNAVLSGIFLVVYSVVNGITLSTIFYVYELGSIFSIFIVAAIVFGVMAIFGFVTKKDLTSVGTIGFMGLIGVIVLGIVNVFIKSDGLGIFVAAIGLAVFIGLTAYDMQKIKDLAKNDFSTSTTVLAMFGALILYLDLINIFLKLLRLFGKRN